MKSALPKALHRIAGRPMLNHLIAQCEKVFDHVAVVAGPEMDALRKAAEPHPTEIQHDRLGTAHAALQAEAHFGSGDVAILYADNPLIRPETMRRLLEARQGAHLVLLAMRPPEPGRYGRVIVEGGTVSRIVEWSDATEAEREVSLCNAGVLCAASTDFSRWLHAVTPSPKGEFYLTDCVALAVAEGKRVVAVEAPWEELRGVNSRVELAEAEATVQSWLRRAAMEGGVTLTAPETVHFSWDTSLAPDVTVGPNVVFAPGVKVASGAEIRPFSHLEGCIVGPGAIVGPFARLRPGTVLEQDVHIGNFVEVKATRVGQGAKANHLTYLGDSDVGAKTNIGAGTITCNYDGFNKFRTTIGAGVFVGTASVLVAPVRLGDGSFVAAGSVVTRDVEPDAMAFGRAQQVDKPGRAKAFRDGKEKA